jgi:glutamate-1-semialdehyde 2,1-aminomutase
MTGNRTNLSDSERSHRVIPGGAHTYSKGDDQFPANAPGHIERGEGVEVWARDGRKFLDWTMGLRSVSLGYRYRPVLDAAVEQIELGSNFGRPSFIETEYAEELLGGFPPYAEMVKYAKNGSNVTTAAVKLARAYTGRDLVALCKDHPFFSFDDWFIGTTEVDAGVPEKEKALSLTFPYGDAGALEKLFNVHPGEVACVILEAATMAHPPAGYLEAVRSLCTKNGSVLIIDEMITGFRWHNQGAQAYYGVEADLATFGKGIANGFSFAALVGRRDILELGGLESAKPRVFLLSGTHSAENHAIAAAMATLRVFRSEPVVDTMWKVGGSLTAALQEAAHAAGVPPTNFQAGGVPCSPWFSFFDRDGRASMPLRTLFLQEMIERGVMINYIAPSFAHKSEHVDRTADAARESFAIVRRALDGDVSKFLIGPPVKPVFRKHN